MASVRSTSVRNNARLANCLVMEKEKAMYATARADEDLIHAWHQVRNVETEGLITGRGE